MGFAKYVGKGAFSPLTASGTPSTRRIDDLRVGAGGLWPEVEARQEHTRGVEPAIRNNSCARPQLFAQNAKAADLGLRGQRVNDARNRCTVAEEVLAVSLVNL